MSGDDLLFDLRDGVAVVTLNRPEAMNALTLDMALALHSRGVLRAEIETAWHDYAEDSSEEKRGRVRALQEELGGAEGTRTRGNLVNPI